LSVSEAGASGRTFAPTADRAGRGY
jgi:hypothetical protein